MALKPQLMYLFWLALLLWVIRERRWRVVLGASLAGVLATLVPLLINPSVFQHYWQAVTVHRPTVWPTPTLGYALRLLFGEQHEWLQFVPLVPGTAWFLAYWARHRKTWDWAEQAPLLLLVSFLTSCYGTWPYDYVLLLVPIVQVACATARDFRFFPAMIAIAILLSINGLLVALAWTGYGDHVYRIWMAPAFLLAYLGLRRQQQRHATQSGAPGCAA